MYVPRHFAAPDADAVRAVLAATDFAPLVTARAGVPAVTHLPVLHAAEGGEFGCFRAHLARANPHWRELAAGAEALLVCQGPHGYVSPAWYRERNVPTWNYVAVHAWCRARLVEDRAELARLVADLMRHHEARAGGGARFEDYPRDYVDRMLRAVVGVELAIVRVEAAFKLSQNRSASEREFLSSNLRAGGAPAQSALADLIERYGPGT